MVSLGGTRYELAGFWVRFLAIFIDGIVMVIFQWIAIIGVIAILGSDAASGQAIAALVGVGYYWSGYARGATFGKQALSLRVLRDDGGVPGPGWGFARYVGSWLSGLALGLGYLWAAWDGKNQTWHDKIAGTFVVREG